MEFYTRTSFVGPSKPWSYYATPEGTGLAEKLLATNHIAAATAGFVCILDHLVYTKPKTLAHAVGRIGYLSSPLFFTASVFTTTTYLMTNLRGKDDALNYFVGGFSCGSVWGAFNKCGWKGTSIGFALGMIGVIKKLAVDQGFVFFPMPRRRDVGSITSYRNDYTLLRDDYPRGWTANPQEV